ncbi:hypothetical protein [Aromatoleum anaerobium]|nr:hypothetical protein [Aromatoleum anaerobium]
MNDAKVKNRPVHRIWAGAMKNKYGASERSQKIGGQYRRSM